MNKNIDTRDCRFSSYGIWK